MYMKNIKLFAKTEKEQETRIQTIRVYIQDQDIGIEFGIEKYIMLTMKSGKEETNERIELPNKKSIRTLERKKIYKYFRIL